MLTGNQGDRYGLQPMSRPLPGLVAFALALGACADSTPPRAVVLITCDTLRADRLGFHGWQGGTSPRLDELAAESLVFDAAWSTAPLTRPAVAALLTGRLPEELGFRDNRQVLSAEATTIAERLADSGIPCAAVVSNWVLRRLPELPSASVQQGFAHFDDRMTHSEAGRKDVKERLANETTDAALAWLDKSVNAERFFLWVHYQDPHGPYTPPSDVPLTVAPGDEPELGVGRDNRGIDCLPIYQVVDCERRPAVYRARYEAEIRFFDRELGPLLDGLRARGILEHALVLFSADHGESLGEHGYYFSHGHHLHQELVRVPLLVRVPSGDRRGRVAAPVSHLDVFPTVLRAFGLDPGATRGSDLLGALDEERVLPQALRGGWAATSARYRLLVDFSGKKLFDRALDPLEEHDLSTARPELVRELSAGRRAFVQRLALTPLPAATPELDAEGRADFDALGYGGEEDEPRR